jgi:predicted KAP-like P-loop ATPase
LLHILYRWRDWGKEEDVKQWVETTVREDHGLITFLEAFLQKGFSQSVADSVGRVTSRLDPQWLEPFLNPTGILDRVQNLRTHNDVTENQRKAIEQFLREYEIRQRGKDPNNPLAWETE